MAKKSRSAIRRRKLHFQTISSKLKGARLCYGKPVCAGERVIIPVASVRMAGGGGHGWENEKQTGGDGFGGALRAEPVGYIDATSSESRFVTIKADQGLRWLVVGLVGAKIGALLLYLLYPKSKHSSGRLCFHRLCCRRSWGKKLHSR